MILLFDLGATGSWSLSSAVTEQKAGYVHHQKGPSLLQS